MTNEKNKTGFLGPAGSFSELAAMQYDRDSECVAFPTISKLLAAFWNKEIDKIILPIENSIEGMVIPSIDNLINGNGKNIIIEGEVELFIMQNLIGIGEKNEIKTVISHPQALAQCANFIEKSGVDIESSDSTSAAVELVAEKKDSSLAAIGTKQAAEIYGLKIIENSIQNSNNNVTRFIVLGHNSKCQTGFDKTSLFFELDNKPGALAIVLIILFFTKNKYYSNYFQTFKKSFGRVRIWNGFQWSPKRD